jgi:two-component system NtrC family response regulator
MAKVLIINREEPFVDKLCDKARRLGHELAWAFTLADGLEKALADAFDVVLIAAKMPDGNGMDALPKIQGISSAPEIIVMDDVADPDRAEWAIKHGAWDYIEKSSSLHKMLLLLTRALQYQGTKKSRQLPRGFEGEQFEGIIGNSPKMRVCQELLNYAANGDANVLITGETGTGKELFALTIHHNSARADKNFVVVDCAALPQTLVESMLFGHEKGAFTGADRTQTGLIKQADGGTLFLDEVSELPLSVQTSFLRVLHERRLRPLGSQREIESDFRLISATNRNLEQMVAANQFRKDLLFRLRAFTIELPPLREHIEDMKDLVIHYTIHLCEKYGKRKKSFSPDFFDMLGRHHWPGNVRELIHALERALSAARDEPVLFPKHLPIYIRVQIARASASREAAASCRFTTNASKSLPSLQQVRETSLADIERNYLKELMVITDRNIKEACRISGLSRSRLYTLLKKYNLSLA